VVIHDLEDFKLKNGDGGLYAILPYDRIDKNGNGLFKVGQADDYKKRFENYHSYYPLGFYYKNLLANPKANRKVNGERLSDKKYLNKIETFIHNDIKKLGGKQLLSTTRIKYAKQNNNIGGDTEWFYTNEKTLDTAFQDANNKFGGLNYSAHLKDINKTANLKQKKATYTGEIYYKL